MAASESGSADPSAAEEGEGRLREGSSLSWQDPVGTEEAHITCWAVVSAATAAPSGVEGLGPSGMLHGGMRWTDARMSSSSADTAEASGIGEPMGDGVLSPARLFLAVGP